MDSYLLFFISVGLHVVSAAALKVANDATRSQESSRRYFKSIAEVQDYYCRTTTTTTTTTNNNNNNNISAGVVEKSPPPPPPPNGLRAFSCGLFVYVPPTNSTIDFGKTVWPPKYLKPACCPRMLLVYQWSGNKIGMPGGKAKSRESALDCVNREFEEEIGSSLPFTDDDYSFSTIDVFNNNKVTHLFAKVTNNLAKFEQLVADSSSSKFSNRQAYIEEIFGVISYPLWIEGPDDPRNAAMWGNDMTHGLPRLLLGFRDPEVILLLLHRAGVVSLVLLQRIFDLANYFSLNNLKTYSPVQFFCSWLNSKVNKKWDKFFTFDELLSHPGVSDLLLKNP